MVDINESVVAAKCAYSILFYSLSIVITDRIFITLHNSALV